jgi:hypothetical protein
MVADNFRPNANTEEAYKFDSFAHAVTVIEEPHRLSHDGMMFHASGLSTIANGATGDFVMITPANCYPHIQRVQLDVEAGEVALAMYEDSVLSSDGTPLPAAINTNRNSARVACAALYGAPTVTDAGNLFHTAWIPPTGAGVGSSVGVLNVSLFGEEWILKPSTKYLFRITNNSGGVLDLRYEFVWYEIDYAA